MLEHKSQAPLSLLPKAQLYPVEMAFKDRLREARKARVPKTTQADIADLFGLTTQAVSGWERGEAMPEPDKLVTLAVFLGKSVGWLLGSDDDAPPAPVPDVMINPPMIPRDQIEQTQGRPDFGIFASAEGGPGQIIITSEPVEFQPRPSIVQNVREAYGLIVTGDSMSPEYRNGDTAIVNPHLPPIGGEVFIFYAERHGAARATIKHLRRATPDKWFVTQHNPPEGMQADFTLSRKEWAVAHRVLGKYSRR
jgi:transcriptional regulator with XRE-family HTH domain